MAAMEITRRTLFEGGLLRACHMVSRPTSAECGELQSQSENVLVLPLSGVFAMHEAPRRHVVATANHAVFVAAGAPYRLSFPAAIGDEALLFRFSAEALERAAPEAVRRDGFDSPDFASHALLPPAAMLERSLLWRRLQSGEADPLEVEEAGVGLLASALRAARRRPQKRVHGLRGRRLRQVERVKEAVSVDPGRRWTLEALAGLACLSPGHLAHVFRDEVGESVYGYVLRCRLASTLDAVLDAGADLSAIALQSGFASHSHFTARWRQFFGLTPSALRRRAGSRQAAKLRRIVTAKAQAAV